MAHRFKTAIKLFISCPIIPNQLPAIIPLDPLDHPENPSGDPVETPQRPTVRPVELTGYSTICGTPFPNNGSIKGIPCEISLTVFTSAVQLVNRLAELFNIQLPYAMYTHSLPWSCLCGNNNNTNTSTNTSGELQYIQYIQGMYVTNQYGIVLSSPVIAIPHTTTNSSSNSNNRGRGSSNNDTNTSNTSNSSDAEHFQGGRDSNNGNNSNIMGNMGNIMGDMGGNASYYYISPAIRMTSSKQTNIDTNTTNSDINNDTNNANNANNTNNTNNANNTEYRAPWVLPSILRNPTVEFEEDGWVSTVSDVGVDVGYENMNRQHSNNSNSRNGTTPNTSNTSNTFPINSDFHVAFRHFQLNIIYIIKHLSCYDNDQDNGNGNGNSNSNTNDAKSKISGVSNNTNNTNNTAINNNCYCYPTQAFLFNLYLIQKKSIQLAKQYSYALRYHLPKYE